MEFKIHTFLGEDLKNSGWTAFIGNTASRPYQYAFGGKKVEVIDSLTKVETAWSDLAEKRFMRALLKIAAIATLIWFSIPLTLCFKGLSYILTSQPSEDKSGPSTTGELSTPENQLISPQASTSIRVKLGDTGVYVDLGIEEYRGFQDRLGLPAADAGVARLSQELYHQLMVQRQKDAYKIEKTPKEEETHFVTVKKLNSSDTITLDVRVSQSILNILNLPSTDKEIEVSEEVYDQVVEHEKTLKLNLMNEYVDDILKKPSNAEPMASIEHLAEVNIIAVQGKENWFPRSFSASEPLANFLEPKPLTIQAPQGCLYLPTDVDTNTQLKRLLEIFPKVIFKGLEELDGATLVSSAAKALADTSGARLFLVHAMSWIQQTPPPVNSPKLKNDDVIHIWVTPGGRHFVTVNSMDEKGAPVSMKVLEEQLRRMVITKEEAHAMNFSPERYAQLFSTLSNP